MPLLQDGDRVDVFARVLDDAKSGDMFIEPWTRAAAAPERR
jgi:hypothetical protein